MFSRTSKMSFTYISWAVSGISCISPLAPTGDSALGSKALSACITARTRLGGIRYLIATWSIISSYWVRVTTASVIGATGPSAGAGEAGWAQGSGALGSGAGGSVFFGGGWKSPAILVAVRAAAPVGGTLV